MGVTGGDAVATASAVVPVSVEAHIRRRWLTVVMVTDAGDGGVGGDGGDSGGAAAATAATVV